MISVIIPIYNMEKYLVRCIDSILNQTYRNLEIILVDDGSTDKSATIIDAYALADHRIKVIHTKNNGVASARNKGLEIAKGGFVSFVDADDYLDMDFFKNMFFTLINNQADICMCSVYNENDTYSFRQYLYASEYAFRCFFDNEKDFTVVVAKLFKRKLFKGLEFKEDIYCDDRYMLVDILAKNPVIVQDDTPYYFPAKRSDSLSRVYDREQVGAINSMLHLVQVLEQEERREIYPNALWMLENTIIDKYAMAYKHLTHKEKKSIKKVYNNFFIVGLGRFKNKIKRILFLITPNTTAKIVRKLKKYV